VIFAGRSKLSRMSLWGMGGVLVLTLISSLAVWWWGSRFDGELVGLKHSDLVSHYFIEGMRATVYDNTHTSLQQLNIESARAEALDEAGHEWRLSQVVLKGAVNSNQVIDRKVEMIASLCLWSAVRQEVYFPESVEVKIFEQGQLSAQLKTRALKWQIREKIIRTDAPLVLQYGSQYTFSAVGADWNMATGQVQLKAKVHGREYGELASSN
jgi:lipopolysaccharide export system protein LptC